MKLRSPQFRKYVRKFLLTELCGPISPDIDDAIATAQLAHLGQTRRTGEAYLEHPKEVAKIVFNYYGDPILCAAALMHDALEDALKQGNVVSDEQMASMIAGSFGDAQQGDEVLRIIRKLTHEKNTPYTEYLISLSNDPAALRIKLADMLHNLSEHPTPRQFAKYRDALQALGNFYEGLPPHISIPHWNALQSSIHQNESVCRKRKILRQLVRELIKI